MFKYVYLNMCMKYLKLAVNFFKLVLISLFHPYISKIILNLGDSFFVVLNWVEFSMNFGGKSVV